MAEAAAVAAVAAAAELAARLSKQPRTAAAADERTAGSIGDRHCSQGQGWWQQQEVLQLLLVTVKVLLASFLLVLLPLVLALATQIQQGLHQVLLEQFQARQTPLPM
jgi:hypothetical protein